LNQPRTAGKLVSAGGAREFFFRSVRAGRFRALLPQLLRSLGYPREVLPRSFLPSPGLQHLGVSHVSQNGPPVDGVRCPDSRARTPRSLLRLDVRRARDLGPLLQLLADERRELGGSASHRIGTFDRQAFAHLRRLESARSLRLQARDDGSGRSRGARAARTTGRTAPSDSPPRPPWARWAGRASNPRPYVCLRTERTGRDRYSRILCYSGGP